MYDVPVMNKQENSMATIVIGATIHLRLMLRALFVFIATCNHILNHLLIRYKNTMQIIQNEVCETHRTQKY